MIFFPLRYEAKTFLRNELNSAAGAATGLGASG